MSMNLIYLILGNVNQNEHLIIECKNSAQCLVVHLKENLALIPHEKTFSAT